MAYKNLTTEEALKIYKAVQLYGILVAKTFQKQTKHRALNLIFVRKCSSKNISYFWLMWAKYWAPTVHQHQKSILLYCVAYWKKLDLWPQKSYHPSNFKWDYFLILQVPYSFPCISLAQRTFKI